MQYWNTEANYTDARGEIRDILTHSSINHLTIITSAPGAVRGNHYHRHTIQYEYVVSGSLRVLSRPADSDEVTAVTAGPGTLVRHDAGEAHTLIALEDTVFLSITEGVRGGQDYEQDTYRLDEPLVDPAS